MPNLNQLIDIKNTIADALLAPSQKLRNLDGPSQGWLAANVTGVAVGNKMKDGRFLQQPALTILVRVKLPEANCGSYFFPTLLRNTFALEINAEDIDVIETGSINSMAGLAGPVNQLTIGADVVMAGRTTHGTICGFATHCSRNHVHLLGCGHVLDGHGGLFKRVASRDAVVADICKEGDLWPGFGRSRVRQVDATLAKLRHDVSPNFKLPGTLGYLGTSQPADAYLWMAVTKAGKTVKAGIVHHTHAKVLIDYPSQTSILDNQLLVFTTGCEDTFAEPGDSGALVVTRIEDKQLWPVGIVIAAGDPATLIEKEEVLSPKCTVVSPLKPILEDLNAELLIG